MEEEIDLRPYVEALLHKWKWIVGATILAVVSAFAVSSVIPPTYEATALVAVTEPGQLVQFDPRFEAVDEPQPLKAYPELAVSDELIQSLFEQVDSSLPDVTSAHQLSQIVEAESGSDLSLVRLIVSHRNAEDAALVANTWAELFVTRANEVYGDFGGGQVAYFETQLATAEAELTTSEEALIAFQSRDRTSFIDNEISALTQEQATILHRLREIALLLQDIEGLREQLAGGESESPPNYADQLTALLLQIKAYGILDSGQSTPLQLQIDPGEAAAGNEVESLNGLVSTLGSKSTQLAERLGELEPRILSLQQQRQELEAESSRLTRDRNLADETYISLARKVEEERITSQDTGGSGVQLASKASVPEKPVRPLRLLNAAVTGAFVLSLAVIVIVIAKWWEPDTSIRKPAESDASSVKRGS